MARRGAWEKRVADPARAEALNGAGVLARNQADYDRAQAWLEESLAFWRDLGD